MQKYGVPLNSRALFTKDDWMTFLAALYYEANEEADSEGDLIPSAFSNALFEGFYLWANETTDRIALSDWTWTDRPQSAGFTNRPVMGAMYAPVLISKGTKLGFGPENVIVKHANRVFEKVHRAHGEM